jgi:hypothetical protein
MIFLFALLAQVAVHSATIAIIDTGFDLDHEFLRPKLLKNETDEEPLTFQGLDFLDNSHLKKPVVEDASSVQDVLHYRDLRAKGHKEGLSLSEFEWFKKKNADPAFMASVKAFKKHAHGTFVAGIALREGENISIFPIRGLQMPNPVVAVDDATTEVTKPLEAKSPEKMYQEEIKNSIDRVSKKFAKICRYLHQKKIEVINASYGITYKNIVTKFRERHRELTGKEIPEEKLQEVVNKYFGELYRRGERTIKKYPEMLFIFSAGNSALDNDRYHHYPSRIKLPNTITVAAMNGEYLASFSNYGLNKVDIGAPGVGIMSLVPKVYGTELYSPASGTSMAAPWISNLAAQILNSNPKLTPVEVKKIIMETGDVKLHLKPRIISGATVNNHIALKAALLTRDMTVEEAINLANSNLIPTEDKISFGLHPAVSPEDLKKKMMDSVPAIVTPAETDSPTSEESSRPVDQVKAQPDSSSRPPSTPSSAPENTSDPVPSSQTEEQSPLPSADSPASSSVAPPSHEETPDQVPSPSSP